MKSSVNRQRGLSLVGLMISILVLGLLLFAGYLWLMLTWSYSSGERAGWVQKLSKKGYICKTWEGEMAMVSLPGSVPEKFLFTVREEQVAQRLYSVMGKRVSLDYEEHIGLPTSCFGDTRHFVTDVRVIEDGPAPLPVPGAATSRGSGTQ